MRQIILPEKYKESLEKRFNPENAKLQDNFYVIEKTCQLCWNFAQIYVYEGNFNINCEECPFHKVYSDNKDKGCNIFIKKILGDEPIFKITLHEVFWFKGNDKLARKQLRKLREEAKKYIIFK